jgi:hypothetical protein
VIDTERQRYHIDGAGIPDRLGAVVAQTQAEHAAAAEAKIEAHSDGHSDVERGRAGDGVDDATEVRRCAVTDLGPETEAHGRG